MMAAAVNKLEVVELLLNHPGTDVSLRDNDGRSALNHAKKDSPCWRTISDWINSIRDVEENPNKVFVKFGHSSNGYNKRLFPTALHTTDSSKDTEVKSGSESLIQIQPEYELLSRRVRDMQKKKESQQRGTLFSTAFFNKSIF